MKKFLITTIVIAMISTMAFSQGDTQTDSVSVQTEQQLIDRPHAIGISLFMIMNFFPDPAAFYQINYSYRFTPKDAIITQAKTWTYYEPIGTYGKSEEFYPGKVVAYGVGVGYQRFHWKNLFTTVQATPFLLQYFDTEDEKIQKGFQLYLQLRLGYRFEFFNKRVFLEPSLVCNYWPVNTNIPPSFAEIDKGTPNYFLFEPGLNIGFRF
ncbi:MAG: hypothetical protein GY790_18145 [Bacteroidetes bacterium]|nr:hypothetical protein [Bacteroidota bacterium]